MSLCVCAAMNNTTKWHASNEHICGPPNASKNIRTHTQTHHVVLVCHRFEGKHVINAHTERAVHIVHGALGHGVQLAYVAPSLTCKLHGPAVFPGAPSSVCPISQCTSISARNALPAAGPCHRCRVAGASPLHAICGCSSRTHAVGRPGERRVVAAAAYAGSTA